MSDDLDIKILSETVEENVNGEVRIEDHTDKLVIIVGNTGVKLTYLKEGYNDEYRKRWLLLDYEIEFASASGRYLDNMKILYFALLKLFTYLETHPEIINGLEIDENEIKQNTNEMMSNFILKLFSKFGYASAVKLDGSLVRIKIVDAKIFIKDPIVVEYLESMSKNVEDIKIKVEKLLSE